MACLPPSTLLITDPVLAVKAIVPFAVTLVFDVTSKLARKLSPFVALPKTVEALESIMPPSSTVTVILRPSSAVISSSPLELTDATNPSASVLTAAPAKAVFKAPTSVPLESLSRTAPSISIAKPFIVNPKFESRSAAETLPRLATVVANAET